MRFRRVLGCIVAVLAAAGTVVAQAAVHRPVPPAAGMASHLAGRQAAVTPPECSTAVASAPSLNARTAYLSVSGNPFGVAAAADGKWAFTALNSDVAVLSTANFKAALTQTIPVPGATAGVALQTLPTRSSPV